MSNLEEIVSVHADAYWYVEYRMNGRWYISKVLESLEGAIAYMLKERDYNYHDDNSCVRLRNARSGDVIPSEAIQ